MKKITFNSYFFSILIVSVLYFILPIVFSISGDLSTLGSYIRSWLCFFILTIISSRLILGKKYTTFYATAFVLLTLLGLGHYLWLVDPNYFQGDGRPADYLNNELQAVFNCVDNVIIDRRIHGLFFFDKNSWYVTHPEIWQIILWPFIFLQNKWLNYSPLNVFASLLASSNIVLLFNKKNTREESGNKAVHKLVLYSTVFFPLWLLNGRYWRDPMGVGLISVGLSLVTLSDNVVKKAISSVLFAFFSYIQRTIYIIIAGLALVGGEMQSKSSKLIKIIIIPLSLIFLYLCTQFYDANVEDSYTSNSISYVSTLVLPIKIVLGIIGPFPWTQFLLAFEGVANVAYQPADYLLGVFQFAYLCCIISNYKSVSFKNLDYSTMMGLAMMISGLMTSVMHIGYIAEGLLFTLPWFFKQFGLEFKKYFFRSFVFLLFLNLIVLAIGNMGISSIWK